MHRLFGTTYPAGTTLELQVDGGDSASSAPSTSLTSRTWDRHCPSRPGRCR
ncbi:hypothetical protein [Catenulispora subtropica]|uniref:hypothetical protein n=1 Tax=Catenulispora subtropica TaxID=450798 RepID=UPI003CD0979E